MTGRGRVQGTVGTAEGAVSYTTCDDGLSYEPTIDCGGFDLFVGRGTAWGAPDEDHGMLSIIACDGEATVLAERAFVWSHEPFLELVQDLCERIIKGDDVVGNTGPVFLSHPCPENIYTAANELWLGLLQVDAGLAKPVAWARTWMEVP